MAQFRVYNIQLLPVDETVKEVGAQGYKRLFSMFRDLNKEKLKLKQEGRYHLRQSEDTFIGPFSFKFPAGCVHGDFIRYKKADAVDELGTGKALFRAGARVGVTSEHPLKFVFDTKLHLFAIESPSFMPSPQIFGDALAEMLAPVVEKHFPQYELTVNIVSVKHALEEVFKKAKSYSVVDLDLTFRNGHDTEEMLRELKETHTKNLTVRASAGKGGRMNGLPKFLKGMLMATASGLGVASISYFAPSDGANGPLRLFKYDSRETPITFQVNRTTAVEDNPDEFINRILAKLREVDEERQQDFDDFNGSEQFRF